MNKSQTQCTVEKSLMKTITIQFFENSTKVTTRHKNYPISEHHMRNWREVSWFDKWNMKILNSWPLSSGKSLSSNLPLQCIFLPLPPFAAANGSFQSHGGSNGPIKSPLRVSCTTIIHDILQMKNTTFNACFYAGCLLVELVDNIVVLHSNKEKRVLWKVVLTMSNP